MSFIERVKSAMGFGDEYEDDFYDDDVVEEYEYEDEKKSINTLFNNRRESREPRDIREPKMPRDGGKIVSLHNNKTTLNIVKPTSFDEAPAISDSLRQGQILLVNTASLEKKEAQRLLDFVSGACYSLDGDVREVESGVYVFSPASIHVDGTGAANETLNSFMGWSTRL